jgi:23S rRNA pseudouridine1911/1915/1917 synthase
VHRAGPLAVLYEDDDLMAVDKPAGMLAVPLARGGEAAPSVLGLLKQHFRADRRRGPFVVHRIDRDTSGIVLFAKNDAAQARLKAQFLRREPERTYQAVVHGHPAPPTGTWRDRLAWDDRALRQRAAPARDPRGREAITGYRTIERYRDASLVELRLVTGKQHQIRVQAALRGHALVGERRYAPDTAPRRRIAFPRQALHACRLTIDHPSAGRRLTIEAPLPADLATLLGRLRRPAGR